MGFAERFKVLREEKGMTLAEIAKKMEVSEATVQRWESGNIKQVRYGRINKLAEVLDTSPAYLMGYDEQSDEELALTEDERKFILMIRKLTPQGRAAAAQMLQSLQALQAQLSVDRE